MPSPSGPRTDAERKPHRGHSVHRQAATTPAARSGRPETQAAKDHVPGSFLSHVYDSGDTCARGWEPGPAGRRCASGERAGGPLSCAYEVGVFLVPSPNWVTTFKPAFRTSRPALGPAALLASLCLQVRHSMAVGIRHCSHQVSPRECPAQCLRAKCQERTVERWRRSCQAGTGASLER